MRSLVAALCLTLSVAVHAAEKPPEEWVAKGEARRQEIPLGGDFNPDPQQPVIIAVGHGARVLMSNDDGANWKQVFFGYPGSDHGGWATNSIAYTDGVFAFPVGWTKPTSYFASDDGVTWRHLSDGNTILDRRSKDPRIMPTAMSIAGGDGTFVMTGYMDATSTPDFGKTWNQTSFRSVKDDQPGRKLVTHHIKSIYCKDAERFLAIGDDRSKEDTEFGNLFASDDMGKTWKWIDPKGLDGLDSKSAMISKEGIVLLADKKGEHVYRSTDAGETWEGPIMTGSRNGTLSVVDGEFWLAGYPSRASEDGKTWRDLPRAVPQGQVLKTDKGTLLSVSRKRSNILRSTDGGESWEEVFSYEPETKYVHGSQGLKDIAFGYVKAAN
ncbi:WD40/YVTN/BNR-like repeat-containing protein [Stratiformator vulcanicus]|uniref:BNR/Asp-box repeat protein n=1 Tax=Stratiformator vulcanicus TaxID=2527980 RepID=A0A517R7N3_9PLAN|nr:hypothetical protein [Stratiformator vulcanicus]QDT39898.1 BNR/Asp-box repeat protein [Stratiformator vulcanicus]